MPIDMKAAFEIEPHAHLGRGARDERTRLASMRIASKYPRLAWPFSTKKDAIKLKLRL